MALYRYVKTPSPRYQPTGFPTQTSFAASNPGFSMPSISITLPRFSLPPYLPITLMALGALLITSVVAPIAYHELITYPRLKRAAMISPLPTTVLETRQLSQVAGITTHPSQPQASETTPQDTTPRLDYTKASNWFPAAPTSNPRPSKITHYTLDIPTLDIKNAVVEIGGNDLQNSLIQYAETANPGEFGSAVIFGHSVLRQFYNPSESNPKRYVSIFSKVMTMKLDDKILINFDGIQYTYKVTDLYEVSPEQVEILRQRYDRQTLKLITCTPEGTYLRRGVVEARLIPSNQS